MKFLAPALLTLCLIAGPAAAFGPTVDLPILTYPDSAGTVSTQGCTPAQPDVTACK